MLPKTLAWTTERRKVSDLVPMEGNPRRLTEKQAKDLTKSLEKFNLVEIPAINMDNTIIAGHQRLGILGVLGRGDEEIDVRVPSRKLSDKEVHEYNVRSNKNTGEWDWDILANQFDTEDLLEWGFSEDELQFSVEPKQGLTDDDEVPEPPEEPVCKRGDLWVLGGHRLLCGDATVVTDVERLMGGDQCELCWADPIYGMDKAWIKILEAVNPGNALILDSDVCVIEYAYAMRDSFQGLWVVYHHWPGLVGSYIPMKCHQIIAHFRYRKYAPGINPSGRSTVFEMGHPHDRDTSIHDLNKHAKPVAMVEYFIEALSRKGDVVLDIFAGMGSCLIACCKLERHWAGIEIDPSQCDGIIKRWENYTGLIAKLCGSPGGTN